MEMDIETYLKSLL